MGPPVNGDFVPAFGEQADCVGIGARSLADQEKRSPDPELREQIHEERSADRVGSVVERESDV